MARLLDNDYAPSSCFDSAHQQKWMYLDFLPVEFGSTSREPTEVPPSRPSRVLAPTQLILRSVSFRISIVMTYGAIVSCILRPSYGPTTRVPGSASHTRIERASDRNATPHLSGEKAAELTWLVCPSKGLTTRMPVSALHNRTE